MGKSILITGISGSGKSAVFEELVKRGYIAYDIEEIDGLFSFINKETGKVAVNYDNQNLECIKKHDWICDKKKLERLISSNKNHISFYCGTASNNDEILSLFDLVFLLIISPDTTSKRLSSRKKIYGRKSEIRDWILSWKNWWENHMIERGAIVIDANRNLKEVTNDIIEKSKD